MKNQRYQKISLKLTSLLVSILLLLQVVQIAAFSVNLIDDERIDDRIDTEPVFSTEDRMPNIVCEISSNRKEYAKEFLLEDGSICSIFSYFPLHKSVNGKWVDISNYKREADSVEKVLSSIQSMDDMSLESRQENHRSETAESLVINWGDTQAAFGGRRIVAGGKSFAVKPENLHYYLSNNKLVVYAGISATCTVSSISQSNVYEVTSGWSNSGAIPSFDGNNVLTVQTMPITQVGQTYSWDITDLYSRWDRGETENNGVAIKNESTSGSFTVLNPCLIIRYLEVDSNDLDYTYHSCDMSKAGILYVNDATTTFRIDQKLIGLKYANYEFNVSRSYDSADNSPLENAAGVGMKFNYESSLSLYNNYAKWLMPNGDTIKFIPSSPLLTQGDYQLWNSINNIGNFVPRLWVKTTEISGFTSTNEVSYSNLYIVADGLKYTFNNNGNLSAIKESGNNNDVFTFTYVSPDLLEKVTSVSDGSYLYFEYAVDNNTGGYCITNITAMDSTNEPIGQNLEVVFNSDLSNDYTKLIQSVQINNEYVCNFVYDFDGRLVSVEDEQGNICEIDYATNAGYASPATNHITGYTLYRENEQNPYDSLLINKDNSYMRTFTHADGTIELIGYDDQYRLNIYRGSDGEYKCVNYGDGNTFIASSGENELIRNNQFDETLGMDYWSRSVNNDDLIYTSSAHSKSGNSLMLTNGNNNETTLFVSQAIGDSLGQMIFEADKTYVFGGWLYTTNNVLDADNEIGIVIEAASVENTLVENITDLDYTEISFIRFDNTIHNSWQYRLQGFKLDEESVVRLKLLYNNQRGAVYFDDLTMFESVKSDSDLDGMLISNPMEYVYSNGLVTEETVTWDRENDNDLYMSASYSYNNRKLQEYIDYNGNSTYYKYNSRTGELSGIGHTLSNNVISDVKSLQYDASSLLKRSEQIIQNVETNANVTLDVEYYNTSGRVEEVQHNGVIHVFEYNPDGTLAETYSDSDALLNGNNDEYCMDYTYSNGDLSVIDYSNGYRIKYLNGTNQSNTTKTISCYSVDGQNETLIKSYVYTYDEDNVLNSVYDTQSGLTISYISSDLDSYELSDYDVLYEKTSNSDGTVDEEYGQRAYSDSENTSFDTVATSVTNVTNNPDGTRSIQSTTNIVKNTRYFANSTNYYHGYYEYEKESVRDYFNRIESKTVASNYQRDNNPGNLVSEVNYEYVDLGNGRTSGLVSEYTQTFYKENQNSTITNCQSLNRKFEYDNRGNIAFVYEENGNNIAPNQYYEYDNANQIITEIDFYNHFLIHYTYNTGGNLTAKVYYDFPNNLFNMTTRQIISIGSEIRRVTYQYDLVWKDRVVSYSDTGFTDDNVDDSVYETISYDKMGNPLNYVGDKTLDLVNYNAISIKSAQRIIKGDLEWNGNRLVSFETDSNRYEYSYDANGYRTSKSIYTKTASGNDTYTYNKTSIIDYVWNNGVLSGILYSSVDSIGQRYNTQSAMIIYDQEGAPAGYISYDGVPYLFKKDINESVLSLVYTDGTDTCSIQYDAWGSPMVTLSGNWIQQIVTLLTLMHSPSLYHGYLYDYESGLYYNQGRCYSSSWGRYVSPESPEKLTERSDNPLDVNLYLFCNNNTVNIPDTVALWSRDYSGVEWQANGFDIKMDEMFASRSMCMLVANQIIKKYGTWSPELGYNINEMNALRVSSDLFAHYVGKTATAAVNKVNACWGDGWILNNQKSNIVKVRKSDPNADKYLKIWKAAPEIRIYALKEGIFISL